MTTTQRAIEVQSGVQKLRTMCRMCLNRCGLIATVEDGVVVRLDGDDDNPYSRGLACAKGRSGFFTLQSPHRVTRPLMRTNHQKGPGIDPRWKEISWEDALDVVAQKMKEVRERDPRRVWHVTFDERSPLEVIWSLAYGTVEEPFASGFFCGGSVHPVAYLNHMAASPLPDVPLTKYILAVGAQYGSVVHYDTMNAANAIGANRESVKVVSVDPICSHGAAMSDEWIAIRPGTDAAFLLSLAYVLVHELGTYDGPFLSKATNAPYLVGEDGRYVRADGGRKPLVWDQVQSAAVAFDEASEDPAILGSYTVNGAEVRPSFQALADHLKRYTPEWASEISSVPASTIRRIAREFGEAASIGSTITMEGKTLPYRPVSVIWYRGLSAHKHAYLNGNAVDLLQTLVGAMDVPGGLMGYNRLPWRATDEGLLAVARRPGALERTHTTSPYPARVVTPPQSIDLFELFPVSTYSRPFAIKGILDPQTYHAAILPEMLIQHRSNMAFTSAPREVMTELLRKIPFIVSIAYEIDETAEFADVVIPSLHYLEKLEPGNHHKYHTGSQPGVFYGSKPVHKPPFDPPWDQMVSHDQVWLELAERAGFLRDVYETCNAMWALKGDYALDPDAKYTYHELIDRYLKDKLGEEKGLDWYVEDGVDVQERTVEERYPGAFPKPRIHVYHEYMIDAGEQVENMTQELNIPWDTSDYIAMPEWRPCAAYTFQDPEYDLFMTTGKTPYHSLGSTSSNPLLRELGGKLGYDEILIHRDAARRKGLSNGDWVEVETDGGKKAQGRIKVTTGIHPEVTAVLGEAGGWSRAVTGGDNDRYTGIHFNSLITYDDDHLDFVGGALDQCLKVKITRL